MIETAQAQGSEDPDANRPSLAEDVEVEDVVDMSEYPRRKEMKQ